jgi:hypothetical protein
VLFRSAIPYSDGHFSRVCTVNSIFYWGDCAKVFSEFWRVLDYTGLLVVVFTTPEDLRERSFAGFARQGLTLLTANEVRDLLEAAGFRDIRIVRSSDRYRKFDCVTARKLTIKESVQTHALQPELTQVLEESPREKPEDYHQPLGQQSLF